MQPITHITFYQEYLEIFFSVWYNVKNGFFSLRRGVSMTYNYNRLWKLLIDRGLTKTELKSIAGVSTNIIAKMGKNEPISMESLAKITTALQCGVDDIVELKN